jgi:hypothetical protein
VLKLNVLYGLSNESFCVLVGAMCDLSTGQVIPALASRAAKPGRKALASFERKKRVNAAKTGTFFFREAELVAECHCEPDDRAGRLCIFE